MRKLVLLAVVSLAGCTVFKVQGSGSKPLALNQIEHAGQRTSPFCARCDRKRSGV